MKQEDINIGKWKHLPKRKKWWERRKLKLRSMGISNRVYDRENKKRYSVQFYDLDVSDELRENRELLKAKIDKILRIFPYDCILYKSKHGLHFISFSLLKGYRAPKARAIGITKELGDQDYWTTGKSLILRISAKWKLKKFSKNRLEVSKKPKFLALIKKPNNYIISNKHLEFYFKYMKLPYYVYSKYEGCDKRDYEISITHYKTRD